MLLLLLLPSYASHCPCLAHILLVPISPNPTCLCTPGHSLACWSHRVQATMGTSIVPHPLPTAHIPLLILSAPHRAQITMGTFIVSFVGNGFVQSAQDWLPLRRFSPQTRRRLLVSLSGRGLG